MSKLSELLEKVLKINPNPLDHWEITAIIESLGYTDHIVEQEFDFPNVLLLGQHFYQELNKNASLALEKTTPLSWQQNLFQEISCFLEQFSHSFTYAIPWIMMFIFEKSNKLAFLLPTELAASLSLAVIASLITSGGFIQIIAYRGKFYFNLGEIELAKKISLQFLFLGLSISVIVDFLGVFFGFYLNLFTDQYLIITAVYYLALSLLWMLCAIISLKKPVWHIPTIFIFSGILFILLIYLDKSFILAQTTAIIFSLSLAILLAALRFRNPDKTISKMQTPRTPILIYSLAPYFCYGFFYFSFLFADRIAAGSAISFASGLSFALDSDYKNGIDLALLVFLILIAITEYLHYKFMNFWYKKAKETSFNDIHFLSSKLKSYYFKITLAILIMYSVLGSLFIFYFHKNSIFNIKATEVAVIGLVGYFIFTVGLINNMILFSLARPLLVLKSMSLGLVLNLVIGYILSHSLSLHYAVWGFVIGASIFAFYSTKQVLSMLSQPDYAYYSS